MLSLCDSKFLTLCVFALCSNLVNLTHSLFNRSLPINLSTKGSRVPKSGAWRVQPAGAHCVIKQSFPKGKITTGSAWRMRTEASRLMCTEIISLKRNKLAVSHVHRRVTDKKKPNTLNNTLVECIHGNQPLRTDHEGNWGRASG